MVLISINKASKCWVSSREKQKRRKTTNQQNTLHLQDQRGQQLQVSRSGLRSQIRSIQVSRSGLRSQMRSLQVSNILDWVFKYGSLHAPNSGLRSQMRSLHVPIFWIEISNAIAPGLKIWFFLLRSQITDEHGTFWEFSFWELRGTIRLTVSSVFGNFIEQVL